MEINKRDVKRILLITLSNIGDIVLTTPVLSILEREFPDARLDVMVGPLGREIFTSHPGVFKVIVYDKHIAVAEKRRLIGKLRNIKYDLIVDLKNTLLPFLIGARYRTSPIYNIPDTNLFHKRDSHLGKLKQLGIDTKNWSFSIFTAPSDRDYIDGLISRIPGREKLIVVSPGAKSFIKRWDKNGFALLCDRLISELKTEVIIVGDHNDRELNSEVESRMKHKPYNLTGRTSITQLAYLLKNAKLLIANDSAPMHLGSAMGTKVLAIFGPTDPRKYAPQGAHDRLIRKELNCSPCEAAQCRFGHECMKSISADEVFETAKEMFSGK